MSEAPAAPAAQDPTTEPPSVEAPAQETDWKAKAREWEARAKANKTAADELAALKAEQMTEAEKAAARLAELETAVNGYRTKEQVAEWKAKVAETTGVPVAALAGSTLEEIEAHAAILSPLITKDPERKGAVGPYVPTEGAAPSGVLGTPADIFGQFLSDQLGRKA